MFFFGTLADKDQLSLLHLSRGLMVCKNSFKTIDALLNMAQSEMLRYCSSKYKMKKVGKKLTKLNYIIPDLKSLKLMIINFTSSS